MRIKKSILIVCIAVCLFAMAGVCAGDANDTAIGPVDEKLEADADDIQVIEEADDGESIGETDEGTFQALYIKIRDAPENTVVNLTNDYKNTDGFSAEGIVINKKLTIDGKGYTIDANKQSRIFKVESGNVVFKNINFINGNSGGDGGAIWFSESGTVENCNFINNTVGINSVNCGGAIRFYKDGNLINCCFINNTAALVLGYGGAVYFWDGTVTNCNFTDNGASSGGALYFIDYSTVINCNFNNNEAYHNTGPDSDGGAISMGSGSVTNCNFTNNSADSNGGAIYFNSDSTVINCNFIANSAFEGGAVYTKVRPSSADTCIFKTDSDTLSNTNNLPPVLNVDNFTTVYGSGEKLTFDLKTNSGMPVDNKNISISIYYKNNDSLIGNYSCLSGGGWVVDLSEGHYYAIYTTEYRDFIPVNRTITIAPNTTFYALNHTINANNNSQINLANDYSFDPAYDTDFAEGIILNRTVTINGNGFTIDAKNQARIFNIQADGVAVRNLTFKNANTSGSGGAIYWEGANGIVSSCSFVNNSARFFGGAINWGGINGVVSACSFVNNSANYSGGAINWGSRNGVVSGCSFENNSASNGGGAVRWSSTDGFLCNSSFVNNSAPNGGAVFWLIGPGSVCNCSFLNNSAGEGIVYFEKDVGSGLNVNGNIFSANNCSAIAFLKSDPTSNIDSNWYDNDADYEGGHNLPQQNSWLVLNATADPATISYSDTAEVMFALYLYDPVSGNSSLYDSAQFEKIRLSITAIKGNASSLAKFGEKITFTSTEAGNGGVTATLGRKSLTVNLTINKAQTAFEASPVTAKYGEDKYLTVTLRNDKGNPIAGASVTVNINGIKTYTTDKNGQIKVKTQGIVPKTYSAKIAFNGNANYVQSAKDVKITIKKAKPKLAAKNKKFKKSKKVKKYAVTLKDANKKPIKKAKLTLKIKGKKAITVKTNKKGKATFKIKKLTKKGRYSAKVTFKGDKCYTKLAKKVKITVK